MPRTGFSECGGVVGRGVHVGLDEDVARQRDLRRVPPDALAVFAEEPDDGALVDDLLAWMQGARADYTNTFRMLSVPGEAEQAAERDAAFAAWLARWRARLQRQ